MRCYVGWLAAAVLVISGCGGGGSGSINNTPPPTPPYVSAVTPAGGSTGIAITTAVIASFSEPMTASTINASTFTLVAQGGSAVAGTVTYSAATNTATLTPSASLAYATSYTATITTGVASSGGAALAWPTTPTTPRL